MESPVVVIDAGTAVCKAGFADENGPQVVVPTVVAYRKDSEDELLIGNDALAKGGGLTLGYPIERAVTKNFKHMEAIYEYIFEQLGPASRGVPVLHAETPFNSLPNRKEKLELFFERFGVPSFAMSYQGVLALYAHSLTSGVVLDVGDGVTQITPVYDGRIVSSAVKRFDFGSRDVTDCLRKLLEGRGSIVGSLDEARKMKEEVCYVSMDYKQDLMGEASTLERTYQLQSPGKGDPETLVVAEERIIAPEILFDPEMIGLENPGIHKALFKCITSCEIDIRKSLYDHVVVCGGGTLLPGFIDRLRRDMNVLAPRDVNLIDEHDRQFTTFCGGSKMASLDSSRSMFVTKHDYDETGGDVLEKLLAL